jgi:glycerol uptake facilitator-like aquaporin
VTLASPTDLGRRLLAEFLGTGLLVTVVVGSGIAATQLSPGQTGLQLLENSTATALGLSVVILLFGPVSGAHLNPLVSVADWALGRRSATGLTGRDLAAYGLSQAAGAVGGSVLANLMFGLPAAQTSSHGRLTAGHLIGEIVATAGLLTLVFGLARTGRAALSAPAIGAYIGAAYWFTSSTAFANPAVTLGRVFTDTFTGINSTSAVAFIAAQTLGAALGCALALVLFPRTEHTTDDPIVYPPEHTEAL